MNANVGCTYGTMLTVDPFGSRRRPSESPAGMMSADPPLTRLAPAPTISAPSRGKSTVCVITRSRASTPASTTVLAPLPGSKNPPRNPISNLPLA